LDRAETHNISDHNSIIFIILANRSG